MKKILAGLALLTASVSVYANDWTVTAVQGANNETVGHIAYTNAIGTRGTTEKMFTSLRMVCSVAATGDKTPYVVLFWNQMDTQAATQIGIRVDNTIMAEGWSQDGTIVFTKLNRLSQLMSALHGGRVVGFEWRDTNNTSYRTAFSLTGFKKAIEDFYTRCKI